MLKKILLKPHHYLLIYAIGLLLFSFTNPSSNKAIDIHLHDTYFVIAFQHIFYALSLFLIFLWVLYHLLNRYFFSKALSSIHIIGTLACVVTFIILHFSSINNMPSRFIDFSQWESFREYNTTAKWYQYGTLSFIILQILFLFNLILGVIKSIKK
jgi:cytochrome c oxidase subunit I